MFIQMIATSYVPKPAVREPTYVRSLLGIYSHGQKSWHLPGLLG